LLCRRRRLDEVKPRRSSILPRVHVVDDDDVQVRDPVPRVPTAQQSPELVLDADVPEIGPIDEEEVDANQTDWSGIRPGVVPSLHANPRPVDGMLCALVRHGGELQSGDAGSLPTRGRIAVDTGNR